MAPKLVLFITIFVTINLVHLEATKIPEPKQTNMAFYMHNCETGNNTNVLKIAGVPDRTKWGVQQFGTLYAIDMDLTETMDRKSAPVGRGRGLYIMSALDASDLYLSLSFEFTNKNYNGSTLVLQGADPYFNKQREIPVISGTGIFRFAKGYAILETSYFDLAGSNAILFWNVTVLHH